jgi:poly(hydroxyalkanoate) depolymerase family esterase
MNNIAATIDRALRAAGLSPRASHVGDATQVIKQALSAAGLSRDGGATLRPPAPPLRKPVFEAFGRAGTAANDDPRFTTHAHAAGADSRRYKLYVPAASTGQPRPLIVMLHGCKQNPDDFAAGTRMNLLAEQHGFLVAYPEQSVAANGSNCWNWFHAAEQTRAGVEASLIAGIAGAVARSHQVDERRVFVAGLSAGAAMAVIAATAYPEVFAGVAAHSGLPLGAARDVPSAFAAMQGRSTASPSWRAAHGGADARPSGVRTIVFHGDADSTVVAANGQAIVEHALSAFAADEQAVLTRQVDTGASGAGRAWSTTRYVDAQGRPHVESWLVHGAAHAWSGGSPTGSYTDPNGPDASAQIVRFFLQS